MAILRDIFNPFCPLEFKVIEGHLCELVNREETPRERTVHNVGTTLVMEKWRRVDWFTTHVAAVVVRVYDEHDFAALPVLADALEEAGCRHELILRHLRGWGPCSDCVGTGIIRVPGGHGDTDTALCPRCNTDSWMRRTGRTGQNSGWERVLHNVHARGCWVIDLLSGRF